MRTDFDPHPRTAPTPLRSRPLSMGTAAALLGVVLAFSGMPAEMRGQTTGTFPGGSVANPCPQPCQGSFSCRLCVLKLDLYRQWMAEIGRGVELHPLPHALQASLQPHFPSADLSGVRIGSTPRQLADGLTDCTDIYFTDPTFTADILGGELPRGIELEFFLHELVHVDQCARLGGRDPYALLWFRDVGMGALALLLAGGGSLDLHGAMPMEAEAAARAAELAPAVAAEAEAEAREP